MYTWGCKALNESEKKGSGCIGFNIQSVHRNGSSHKQRQQEMDTISFNRKLSLPNKKVIFHASVSVRSLKTCLKILIHYVLVLGSTKI